MGRLLSFFINKNDVSRYPGFGIITLLFFLFLYLPIMVIIAFSFNENKIVSVWNGFSTKWYTSAINNQTLVDSLQVSLTVAFISTFIATVIAVSAALALTRGDDIKNKNFSIMVVNLPLMLPEIVFAVAILILFSLLGVQNGMLKLILAHTCFCIPFAFLPIRARLQGMNNNLEHASQDLYATPWVTFRRITLPLIMPGVFAGGMLSFVISMDDFITSNIVSGGGATTLPVYIFSLVKQGVSPELNAISTLIMVASLLIATPALYFATKK
ncbi:ABC transporter permease [Neptunomonas qingdaonensis]|uniref:Spermidine/putrescine transport system permease protein PotC n=1 Tax=Neptunomonas qingdaonensis TaxID=1045558 RepID=A0A1I2V2B9_9GAMM|nr:ABC transporter permease [Neptunomonas qingdaonensis]SFG83113.1 spermidine/putrescine transport system permease protein [Neptunomonas qingdaonensis]